MFSWSIGLAMSGMIMRVGQSAESFAWAARVHPRCRSAASIIRCRSCRYWMQVISLGLPPAYIFEVQFLGGAPVGMPMTESYDSLSKGVADGILCPNEALEGFKLGEVTAYTTENYGSAYSSGFFVVMNKAKWNSLPKDIQAIIEKINGEWIEKQGKVWDDIDIKGKDFAVKLGMKYIPLAPEEDARWVKAVRPILDEYVQTMKTKNLPGDEALKFCLDYLKANQK